MASLVKKYFEAYKRNITSTEREGASAKNEKEKYLPYEEAASNGGTIEVNFDFADTEGNLSATDNNGVKLILEAETLKKDLPYYEASIKNKFMGLAMITKVKSIDKEKGIVYLSSGMSADSIKGGLIKELCVETEKGNRVRCLGEVIKVNDKQVLVNILHRNILGIIKRNNWSNSYVRTLDTIVSVGDVVEFDVVQRMPKKKQKDYAFICDRKPYAEDPWKKLPEFGEGDVVMVKCVDLPKDRQFFWGVSKSAPGIEIQCNFNQNLSILKSCVYKCRIREFNRAEHKLRCTPFEQISAGIGSLENVKFVNSGARKKG